jgi:regulator of sigma E protease
LNLSWQHLLAFLFAVGLLVTVHEYGHYWVARRLGFKVLRFSVGFGKALWSRTGGADRTEYVLAAIPLGGYVKLLDEREGPVDPAELHRAFTRRPHWQRILVLLAGPGFNIIFAILVAGALFWHEGVNDARPVVGTVLADSPAARAGLASGVEITAMDGAAVAGRKDVIIGLLDRMSGAGSTQLTVRGADGATRTLLLEVSDPTARRKLTEPENLLRGLGFGFWVPPAPPKINDVVADGPAAQAGLAAGDVVLAFNGTAVADAQALSQRIAEAPGEEVVVTVLRAGTERSLRVRTGVKQEDGRRQGMFGISIQSGSAPMPASMLSHRDVGPFEALALGATEAWRLTVLQGKVFGRMLTGHVSLKNLSGPLTIAEYAGESARSGVATFASFLMLISLSLGFLNLLPVPILDGGQIVYQVVEWIKGSPLSERAQLLGQQVGIGLLVLMMGVALFNDITRQFG